ncbi:MAG: tRNA (adenosine(37)-N6)-dimethylallyltransferase MiaA [Patescibacteria group bacterium]
MKKKIIIVLGPTASGKSGIALELAKKFNGFLISADSRQVFRKMNIGTNKDQGVWVKGKFSVDGIEECLIDLVDPNKYYCLENWLRDLKSVIETHPNKLPIIVGGTGLYISALVNNYELPGMFDPKLRDQVEKWLAKYGLVYLINKAKKIDSNIGEKIDLNNPRRVTRALEILMQTKKPLARGTGESEYEFLQLGISMAREELYQRINARVDMMMKEGLVDEVKKLMAEGYNCKSAAMSGIGYRQICQFLNHEISGEQAVELIQRDTRRYAKRQMTWFKRDKTIHWVKDVVEAKDFLKKFIQ